MWCSTRWRVERLALLLVLQLGLVGCTLASTGPLAAGAPSIAAVPAASHPQLAGSRLQGEAKLRFWGMRIYHAQLWTLANFEPERADAQPLVLELAYLRDLKGSAIAERSLQEMRRAANFTDAQAQRWLARMQSAFPDVRAGDRLTGLHQPGQGADFWHNGRPSGRVDDAEFARLFFGIWLAPTTAEPDLRLALLGLKPREQRQ